MNGVSFQFKLNACIANKIINCYIITLIIINNVYAILAGV